MWYVIQITTGNEEKMVHMIRRLIPREVYTECFYIKRECVRKEKDGFRSCLTAMFPGYLFVDTEHPEEMYQQLKRVPKLTKLLKEEEIFLAVSEEEQHFLEEIESEGHIVRRSLVTLDTDKQIIGAEGAVGRYLQSIVRQRIRKRYVLIEKELLGEKRELKFGIRLEGDKLAEE